jgi:hypothetical protein
LNFLTIIFTNRLSTDNKDNNRDEVTPHHQLGSGGSMNDPRDVTSMSLGCWEVFFSSNFNISTNYEQIDTVMAISPKTTTTTTQQQCRPPPLMRRDVISNGKCRMIAHICTILNFKIIPFFRMSMILDRRHLLPLPSNQQQQQCLFIHIIASSTTTTTLQPILFHTQPPSLDNDNGSSNNGITTGTISTRQHTFTPLPPPPPHGRVNTRPPPLPPLPRQHGRINTHPPPLPPLPRQHGRVNTHPLPLSPDTRAKQACVPLKELLVALFDTRLLNG